MEGIWQSYQKGKKLRDQWLEPDGTKTNQIKKPERQKRGGETSWRGKKINARRTEKVFLVTEIGTGGEL